MPIIEVDFPGVGSFGDFIDDTKCIDFSDLFEGNYRKGEAFVLNVEGDIPNFPQGVFFDEFVAYQKELMVEFQSFPMVFDIKGSVKLTIRRLGPTDIYPESINRPIQERYPLKAVLFYYDEFDGPRFLNVVSCKFSELFKNAVSSLNDASINTDNVKIGHFQGTEHVQFFNESSLSFNTFNAKEVITVWTTSINYIPYMIDDQVKLAVIYPTVPRRLFNHAMRVLDDNPRNQSARRLAVVALNSGVPIQYLPKFIPGIEPEHIQHICIPLNLWGRYLTAIRSDPVISFAIENLVYWIDRTSNEAVYRSLFLDTVLARMLSVDTTTPRSHQKFKVVMEHQVSSFLEHYGRIDFAAVSESFGHLPFFLAEMGAEWPHPEDEHKDSTKLTCICSQTCIKKVHRAVKEGKDPKSVKVFGLWIGATQFRLCVAHPVFTDNEEQKYTEVSVHLSFPAEWQFDLVQLNNVPELRSTYSVGTEIKATIIEGLTDIQVPQPAAANRPIATRNHRNTTSRNLDYSALCKLNVFIDCAKESQKQMESNPPIPLRFPLRPQDESHIPSANSSSTATTPAAKRIMSAKLAREKLDEFVKTLKISKFNPQSTNMQTFQISKKISYEAQVYLNAGLFLPFLPRLLGIDASEKGPEYQKFTFERMDPLIEPFGGGLSVHFRMEHAVLEAVTFAIHVLFELHNLHTKIGCVHSDISLSNIMFSKFSGIWKLNDFNQSLPLNESLQTSRVGGTHGYRDPEAEYTGIFTPASDVYSLGRVLSKLFKSFSEEEAVNSDPFKKEFAAICSRMTEEDPEKRIGCRDALEGFFFLFQKLEIPDDFEVYGANSIFPLVEREFMFDRNGPESVEQTQKHILLAAETESESEFKFELEPADENIEAELSEVSVANMSIQLPKTMVDTEPRSRSPLKTIVRRRVS